MVAKKTSGNPLRCPVQLAHERQNTEHAKGVHAQYTMDTCGGLTLQADCPRASVTRLEIVDEVVSAVVDFDALLSQHCAVRLATDQKNRAHGNFDCFPIGWQ